MKIGDKVKYTAGTYGQTMTVEKITRVECTSIPSYDRIQAGWFNGTADAGMVEARADLFILAQP
jgi:hypothetical protein